MTNVDLTRRCNDSTYYVKPTSDGAWEVGRYVHNGKLVGIYQWEILPEWITKTIAVLDAAELNKEIPHFGVRTLDTYWIFSSFPKGFDGEENDSHKETPPP